jgi:hypothetical protein
MSCSDISRCAVSAAAHCAACSCAESGDPEVEEGPWASLSVHPLAAATPVAADAASRNLRVLSTIKQLSEALQPFRHVELRR